jgi:hypothetical protein
MKRMKWAYHTSAALGTPIAPVPALSAFHHLLTKVGRVVRRNTENRESPFKAALLHTQTAIMRPPLSPSAKCFDRRSPTRMMRAK